MADPFGGADARRLLPDARAARGHGALVARLCVCAFFVNCKPSEPFLSLYLEREQGLTEQQLDSDVWPYDAYGAFACMLPAGLLAEHAGYRATILLGLACREATRLLLLYARGAGWMALSQLMYAAAECSSVIYVSYVYVVAPAAAAPLATAAVLTAYHAANIVGSLLGQALLGLGASYRALFYVSWGATTLGVLAFFAIPTPRRPPPPSVFRLARERGVATLAAELRALYAVRGVRLWALWWLLGYASLALLRNYFQLGLLADAEAGSGEAGSGAAARGGYSLGYAEAAVELACTLGALAPAILDVSTCSRWALVSGGGSAAVAACLGAALLLQSPSLPLLIALNAAPMGIYTLQQACGSAALGAALGAHASPRYALVFTTNTFGALGGAAAAQVVAARCALSTRGYYWLLFGTAALLAVLGAAHEATVAIVSTTTADDRIK